MSKPAIIMPVPHAGEVFARIIVHSSNSLPIFLPAFKPRERWKMSTKNSGFNEMPSFDQMSVPFDHLAFVNLTLQPINNPRVPKGQRP